MSTKIAKVVVGLPVDGPFDYSVHQEWRDRIEIGRRVRVSFNRRNRVGFIVGGAAHSSFKKLNPIIALLDDGPVLDDKGFACAKLFSAHYGCSLGEAIETFLPSALRSDRTTSVSYTPAVPQGSGEIDGKEDVILVHDYTQYKRWPYLIDQIQHVLDRGKNCLVLVPEGSFIQETLSRLQKALTCPIAVFEKKLSTKNELDQWGQIRNGKYKILIGTRSAIFAPMPDLGMIIINEEDNSAYKQEQTPYYRVHEVAQMRAKVESCRVMFVSSLPSAELWEQSRKKKWLRVKLAQDYPGTTQIIDMSNYNPGKTSILSFPLQNAMQQTLERKGKVVLYMNRVGFATRTHCQLCGFGLKCERCDVYLTYLYSKKMMVCRHCNYKRELPKICPSCKGSYLKSTGKGVEKLESEVARLYPSARINRYDGQIDSFPENADIIIATQALFRRHDQWQASLVALLNFDAHMHHIDFRSGHKAFALLVHLRQLASEKFLVQTRMMDNYCLRAIQSSDFNKFYREELKVRKELGLPPYQHLIEIGLRGVKEEAVQAHAQELFIRLDQSKPKSMSVSDPHPDVNPKLRDKYRFTIIAKGKSVKIMLAHIKKVLKGFKKGGSVITVNVDP